MKKIIKINYIGRIIATIGILVLFTTNLYAMSIPRDLLRIPISSYKRLIRIIEAYREGISEYSDADLEVALRRIAEETNTTYDNMALDYAKARTDAPSEMDVLLLNHLLDLIREKVKEEILGDGNGRFSLLDRGTGPGRDLKWFHENAGDVSVLGIDNSDGFIAILTRRAQKGDFPSDCFAKMDMTDLRDIPDASYDAVRDNASLLHLPDTGNGIFRLSADRAVQEAERVLKLGGQYFAAVKEGTGLEPVDTGEGLGARWFQFYTSETITELLERNGLKVLAIRKYIEHRSAGDIRLLYVYAEKPLDVQGIKTQRRPGILDRSI